MMHSQSVQLVIVIHRAAAILQSASLVRNKRQLPNCTKNRLPMTLYRVLMQTIKNHLFASIVIDPLDPRRI